MNLHSGHRERVRAKFIKHGLDDFADHEVLEMLLFYAYARSDTNETAHLMLREFGSLANLMEASTQEIMRRCGVTERIAVLISMVPHLAKRYAAVKWTKRIPIDSVQKAGEFAKTLFIGKTTEHFFVICLDAHRQLLYPAFVAEGSLTDISIYPRKVVEEALKHQSSHVILTHNHPSGKLRPSRDDEDATFLIERTLRPLDITLLDHIVVAGEKYYSFSEHGKLDTIY